MAKSNFTSAIPSIYSPTAIGVDKFAEGRINTGVITMVDPADIPAGALRAGKNITVRFDRTSRREGTVLLDPAKPDSYPVLATAFVKLKTGVAYTLRFTHLGIHSRGASLWETFGGPPLVGSVADRYEIVNVLDTIIFANNGANNVQIANVNAGTWGNLGNAPNYRHITGFYNRAVGAALKNISEVQVGWSADGVVTEWDPNVNETAGFSPILESPSDLSDFIVGIYGFTNVMIVMREQSIWLATKKPIPTDPFNFYAVFPGIGCDIPGSIAVIPNGLAWLDTRTGTAWAYTPGSAPEPIGRPIEATILRGISDPASCFGSYNNKQNEYTVAIPRVGTALVTTWTYNFRTKAWAEGAYSNITSLNDIELATGQVVGGSLTIDDLVGTIDQLVGTIDSLVASGPVAGNIITSTRLFGRADGEILLETPNAYDDAGVSFETLIDSKTFNIPTDDIAVMELRIEFLKNAPGTMEIYWSKDAGATFKLYKTIADTYLTIGSPKVVKTFGPMKTRNYVWRVRSTTGAFDIISFEILISRAGASVSST